jgi:hypothetical protein
MKYSIKNLSLAFVAGAVGGLANLVAIWSFGALGVPAALGVKIAPQLTAPWLYNRLVWGGLWGVLFFLPFPRWSWPARGLIYSLGPSLVQLLVVFPFQGHKGFMGLQLGALTPVFVIFYNAIWGLVAGFWLKRVEE